MKISVIIPAAGTSSRFGVNKLDRDLGGRPMLVRTVEAFTRREEVFEIIVAGPPDGLEAFSERFGPTLSFHGVHIVAGGRADRWESVANALKEVSEEATHVAVHDAARPCVGAELLDRLFEAAASLDAVVPAIAVSSTIKSVDQASATNVAAENALADAILGDDSAETIEARAVTRTVDREGLMLAQTPQVFAREVLVAAYATGDAAGTTDDASVVERAGGAVHVVDGDPRNIKVTTPPDLDLARAVLRTMSKAAF